MRYILQSSESRLYAPMCYHVGVEKNSFLPQLPRTAKSSATSRVLIRREFGITGVFGQGDFGRSSCAPTYYVSIEATGVISITSTPLL